MSDPKQVEDLDLEGGDGASAVVQNLEGIEITIRTIAGQSHTIRVPSLDVTVTTLKEQILAVVGTPIEQQRLIYSGKELMDNQTLSSCKVVANTVVHMVIRPAANVGQPAQQNPTVIQQQPSIRNGQPVIVIQNGGQTGPYGEPQVQFVPQQYVDPTAGISIGDQQRLSKVYQRANAVRVFAIIDGIFVLLIALNPSYWPALLGLILVYLGYLGARRYHPLLIAAYALFVILAIAGRGWLITGASSSIGYRVILAIGVLIEVYIFVNTVLLIQQCRRLTADDKQVLELLRQTNERRYW